MKKELLYTSKELDRIKKLYYCEIERNGSILGFIEENTTPRAILNGIQAFGETEVIYFSCIDGKKFNSLNEILSHYKVLMRS